MTGSGTLLDPYVIQDVNDLQNMNLDLAGNYELANNINASATSGWNPTTDRGVWAPSVYYNVNDYVTYLDVYYVCFEAHLSSTWSANSAKFIRFAGKPSAYLGFIPIRQYPWEEFSGSLDGKGFTITGLHIDNLDYFVGMFSFAEGATIKNLKLKNIYVRSTEYTGGLAGALELCTVTDCSVSDSQIIGYGGKDSAGGLVGWLDTSTMENCHAYNITMTTEAGEFWCIGGLIGSLYYSNVTKCSSSGTVSGYAMLGGLAGWARGKPYGGGISTINKCFSTCSISGIQGQIGGLIGDAWDGVIINDCYARGSVMGDSRIGGLVGELGRTGATSTVDKCYSTGLVTGNTNTGGLIGKKTVANVTDSFWDTQTSGKGTSDGGTGKTTAEMKVIDTLLGAGWDIDAANHGRNDGYPCLGWEVGSPRTWLAGGWASGLGRKRQIPLGLVVGKGGFVHARR